MKLGLKLWSSNTDAYLREAEKLYSQKVFDYIELYVVPGTVDTIEKWKKLRAESNIPFTLHAPHFIHDVNLANQDKEKTNIRKFDEVKEFAKALDASYIVVHSGIEGNIDEAIRQLKIINLSNMLIENKPYIAPLGDGKRCRGAEFEEIVKVIDEIGCGFCLDVGHSICTANSLKLDPYEFLAKFNTLNPTCYHLSDNFIDTDMDKHLHFGQGNYDLKRIFGIIDTNKNIAIETNKNSRENLDDFVEDVKWLKNL